MKDVQHGDGRAERRCQHAQAEQAVFCDAGGAGRRGDRFALTSALGSCTDSAEGFGQRGRWWRCRQGDPGDDHRRRRPPRPTLPSDLSGGPTSPRRLSSRHSVQTPGPNAMTPLLLGPGRRSAGRPPPGPAPSSSRRSMPGPRGRPGPASPGTASTVSTPGRAITTRVTRQARSSTQVPGRQCGPDHVAAPTMRNCCRRRLARHRRPAAASASTVSTV